MRKHIIILLLLLVTFPSLIIAQKGCCSSHKGLSHCGNNGMWICNDGTQSPTCTCNNYTYTTPSIPLDEEKNNTEQNLETEKYEARIEKLNDKIIKLNNKINKLEKEKEKLEEKINLLKEENENLTIISILFLIGICVYPFFSFIKKNKDFKKMLNKIFKK